MQASDFTFLRSSLGLSMDSPLTLESPRDLQQSRVTVVNDAYFYKRCCVFDLTLKSPRNPRAKWVVTLQSFYNEHLFLACYESFDFHVPRVVSTVVVGGEEKKLKEGMRDGEETKVVVGGEDDERQREGDERIEGEEKKGRVKSGSAEGMTEPRMAEAANGNAEDVRSKNGNAKKIARKSKQITNPHTKDTENELLNINDTNPIMSGNGKHVMLTNTNQPINFHTKFQTLTEYMKSPDVIEVAIFNSEQSKAVLEWCATFHACFVVDCKLKTQMFDRGGWWRKPLRPTIKWNNAPCVFLDLQKTFPREFGHFHSSSVGKMETIAKWAENNAIAAELERLLPSGFQTMLMHGDVKSSNFFFKQNGQAVGIDFQWVGGAVCGAADVVYMLFGSAGLVEGTGTEGLDSYEESGVQEYFKQARKEELALIEYYFSAFDTKQSQKQQHGNRISREVFDVAYDLEFLEYFSAAVPYLLADLDKKTVLKNRKKYGYLTYEKDVRLLAYFFVRGLEAYDAVASRMTGRVVCENSG